MGISSLGGFNAKFFLRGFLMSNSSLGGGFNPLNAGVIYDPLHVIIACSTEKIDFFDRFFLMESWHRISHSETIKTWFAFCFALCFRTFVRWIRKKHWFFGKPPTLRPPKPRKFWKSQKTKKCCGQLFRWTAFLVKTCFLYLKFFRKWVGKISISE